MMTSQLSHVYSLSIQPLFTKYVKKIVPNTYVHFITTKSGFRYCVIQSPDPNNLQNYKDLFLLNGVKTLVKLCEETLYDTEYLLHNGINVINLPLKDGTIPSKKVINEWVNIIKQEMKSNSDCIAVHCMSGLGRAPLFVCIGLILIDHVDPVDSVKEVRKIIRYALNTKQIKFIETLNCYDKNNSWFNWFNLCCTNLCCTK